VMQSLTHDPVLGHITTFGGHPVSCAAGLATLEVLLGSDLMAQVPAKAALFRDLLQHPNIVELRGKGLWFAVDVGSFEAVQRVMGHCLSQGVLTDWFLFNERSLRIAPPLTIDADAIEFACSVMLEGIGML
jgi:acetylornithine/N-succinyldiaminopimelate aminotransferase